MPPQLASKPCARGLQYIPFAVFVDVVGHLEEELRLQALLLVGLLPGGALRVGGGRSSCALVVRSQPDAAKLQNPSSHARILDVAPPGSRDHVCKQTQTDRSIDI